MPKLPKITSFLFLCMFSILKKEVNDEVDFLHADNSENYLKLIL